MEGFSSQGILELGVLAVLLLLVWQTAWAVVRAVERGARWALARDVERWLNGLTAPLHAHMERRFPRTRLFLVRRTEPRRFTGLPLTLLLLAALYVAALMGGLIEEMIESTEITRFDNTVQALLEPLRDPLVIVVFGWITGLGDSQALVALSLVTTAFFWAHGRFHMIPGLWTTILGTEIMTWAGKFAFDRDRPVFITGYEALSPSFPSAHAAAALAVYGFVAYALARELPVLRARFETGFWAIVLIGLIGLSRMVLSVHYASDVAAGYLVGGFWLLMGITAAEWGRSRGLAR